MNQKTSKDDFDPSLHIIPLDPQTRTPVVLLGNAKDDNILAAVTDDGRISFFPIEADNVFLNEERIARTYPLIQAISARIAERFPNEKDIHGNQVNQFLAVGVMYGIKSKGAKFIFEVWGFSEHFGELDTIYSSLHSLGGITVGSKEYKQIENYLSSEPVCNWVNELIMFLKEQLDWPNYVRGVLDNG